MFSDLQSLIAAGAGVILSLVAEAIPQYRSLEKFHKRLVMAAALALSAVAVFGISCYGWLGVLLPGISISCDEPGAQVLAGAFLTALIANQSVFQLAFSGKPKPQPEPEEGPPDH